MPALSSDTASASASPPQSPLHLLGPILSSIVDLRKHLHSSRSVPGCFVIRSFITSPSFLECARKTPAHTRAEVVGLSLDEASIGISHHHPCEPMTLIVLGGRFNAPNIRDSIFNHHNQAVQTPSCCTFRFGSAFPRPPWRLVRRTCRTAMAVVAANVALLTISMSPWSREATHAEDAFD